MSAVRTQGGLAAIDAMFAHTRAQGRAAFLPYMTMGYPTLDDAIAAVQAMSEVGVDGFEIGVPFSDPLADGPAIQAASQRALDNGVTVAATLGAVRQLRAAGVAQPMLLFSYANPLLAYGAARLVADAAAAGIDGLIVPDLPAEEADMFAPHCAQHGLALVMFVAPTTTPERVRLAAAHASGFLYVVSVTGITGARQTLPTDLADFVAGLRAHTDRPLVMGFGISTPGQARAMNGLVDGFIVGSALVRAAADGVGAVRDLAASLRAALDT